MVIQDGFLLSKLCKCYQKVQTCPFFTEFVEVKEGDERRDEGDNSKLRVESKGHKKDLADRYNHDRDQQMKENGELKETLLSSQALIKKLKADMNKFKVDNESLRAKVSRQEKDIKTLTGTLQVCTDLLDNREAAMARCREDMESLKAKVSCLKNDKEKLEKELERCEAVKEGFEKEASQHNTRMKWLMKEMKTYKSLRDALEEKVVQLRTSKAKENFDHHTHRNDYHIVWFMGKMEQLKSERDSLQSRVDVQCRSLGQLQADLSRCIADKANLKKMAMKPSQNDKFGLKQVLLQCQLEKEQLQATVTRYKLDIDMLESRLSRQEEDKKHAWDLSALLQSRLTETLKQKSVNKYNSQGSSAELRAEKEDSSGKLTNVNTL